MAVTTSTHDVDVDSIRMSVRRHDDFFVVDFTFNSVDDDGVVVFGVGHSLFINTTDDDEADRIIRNLKEVKPTFTDTRNK